MDKVNRHIAYKTRQVNNVLDFLKDSRVSQPNYIGTDMPFFMKNNNKVFNIGYNDIPEMPKGLNRNIQTMFKLIGNPLVEIYIGDWTIMSLNQCIDVYNNYCNNSQTKVFDIGYMYIGMGHIKMLSCDLEKHILFYRIDGGGDGYARDYHRYKILNYNPTDYEFMYFTDFVKATKLEINL